MSGICAVWRKENPARVAETLATAVRGLSLAGSERVEHQTDGPVGVGISKGFDTQQVFENDRVLVACDADLYDVTPASHTGDKIAGATYIAELYERHGRGFAEKLRGAFSVILWDKRERKLIAAVDGFSIHRLVYLENHEMLLVASRIDA